MNFTNIIEVQMITAKNIYVKHHNVHSRDPSNNLAQSTMSILSTHTHTHTFTYHVQPLTLASIRHLV